MHRQTIHERYKCDKKSKYKQEHMYQILNSMNKKCRNKKRRKRKGEWKNRKKKRKFQKFLGGI